jgi:hypothetical protein
MAICVEGRFLVDSRIYDLEITLIGTEGKDRDGTS